MENMLKKEFENFSAISVHFEDNNKIIEEAYIEELVVKSLDRCLTEHSE